MKVYPVVHITSPEQAVEQTGIAIDAQADGVFLIHHGNSQYQGGEVLVNAFNDVTTTYPDLFVGMNYLGLDPLEGYTYTQRLLDAHSIVRAPDALWFDDATGYARTPDDAVDNLRRLAEYRQQHPAMQQAVFMGGVAFKYTHGYTDDPEQASAVAARLAPLIDVVTTSGAGTGHAPSPEKIIAMGRSVKPGQLAVASGVSIENIQDYSDQPDMSILVASSLETYSYSGEFVPERVRAIVEAAHSIMPPQDIPPA